MDTTTWQRTTRGKIICPECGGKGWPVVYGPSWLDKHAHHVGCPDCGEVVTSRGLANHMRKHRR